LRCKAISLASKAWPLQVRHAWCLPGAPVACDARDAAVGIGGGRPAGWTHPLGSGSPGQWDRKGGAQRAGACLHGVEGGGARRRHVPPGAGPLQVARAGRRERADALAGHRRQRPGRRGRRRAVQHLSSAGGWALIYSTHADCNPPANQRRRGLRLPHEDRAASSSRLGEPHSTPGSSKRWQRWLAAAGSCPHQHAQRRGQRMGQQQRAERCADHPAADDDHVVHVSTRRRCRRARRAAQVQAGLHAETREKQAPAVRNMHDASTCDRRCLCLTTVVRTKLDVNDYGAS